MNPVSSLLRYEVATFDSSSVKSCCMPPEWVRLDEGSSSYVRCFFLGPEQRRSRETDNQVNTVFKRTSTWQQGLCICLIDDVHPSRIAVLTWPLAVSKSLHLASSSSLVHGRPTLFVSCIFGIRHVCILHIGVRRKGSDVLGLGWTVRKIWGQACGWRPGLDSPL